MTRRARTTRRDRTLLTGAAVVLVALVSVAVLASRGPATDPPDRTGPSGAIAARAGAAPVVGAPGGPATAPATSSAPATPAGEPVADAPAGRSLAEALAGDRVYAAGPDAVTASAADTSAAGQQPAPVVATGVPRGPATPPPALRSDPDGAVVGPNGCLVAYGDAGQCLPAEPRSAVEMGMTRLQMPWQCEEVRLDFPGGLAVAPGQDVLGLDSDGDGTACGPGDDAGRGGAHTP